MRPPSRQLERGGASRCKPFEGRRMHCAVLLYFATCLVTCSGGDVSSQPGGAPLERGHVMVHKEIQSKHLVQGQPFDVVYTVMNVGLDVAYQVVVTDIYPDLFEVKAGKSTVELGELAPGANSTSTLTLVPKVAGIMTVARAEVRYKWLPAEELELELEQEGEGEGEEEGGAAAAAAGGGGREAAEKAKAKARIDTLAEDQVSYSSSQDKVEIFTPEKFARLSKQRLPTVAVMVVGAALSIAFPWYMYQAACSAPPGGKNKAA